MAIQPMALAVQNPEINAVQAMSEGAQAGQQMQANNLALAQQSLQNIGQLAFGVMGGSLDGPADPQRWEEALDMIGGMGVNVDQFRGRADLAPVIARASADTLGQLQLAQNERELQQRLAEFDFKVSEAMKGPAPTADMQNFALSQNDPAFAQYLRDQNTPNPPSSVGEYNFYAEQERAAGREPLPYAAFQQSMKGNGVSMQMPDGTIVQVGGAAKPLTEGQGKDTVYATRAEGALPIIDQFGSALLNPLERAVEGDPTGIVRRMQSEEFQQAQQAGKEFLQAILRKDTGAAITPQETAEYGSVYLPVPGDGPAILEQKRLSRLRALEAIKAGLPAHAILAQEQALANTTAAGGAEAIPSGSNTRLVYNPATGELE